MNDLTPPRRPQHPAAATPSCYEAPPARSEDLADGLSLRSMIVVLRRYWWLILVTTLAAGGLAFLHGLRADPAFKATATVVIEDSRQAIAGNLVGAAAERGGRSDPFASQLEILRSHAVLGAAVDQSGMRLWPVDREVFGLRLRDLQVREESSSAPIRLTFGRDSYIAEHGETIVEAPYGDAVALPPASFAVHAPPVSGHESAEYVIVGQRAAALFLRGRVEAARRGATNLVDVSVTAADPLTAQIAVNALVTAFANHSEAMARQASERRREFLREQLTSTDARLADVQRELIDFRRRERVFSSREQFAAEQSGLMTLEVNREQLLTDRQMFAQLLEGVRQAEPGETVDRLHALVSLPEIASNPVVSELYRQLVEYERERNNMTSGRWSRAQSNPDVERLDGLITATTGRMATGVQSHLRSLDARIAALDRVRGQRVASIQERPETEAEESHLVQQVEAVRGVADQLRSEYQRAQIAAAVEGGEIQIVDFADVPGGPIGSGALRLVIMGLVAGLFLGSGGAFLLDNLNTSIRRQEDLEEALRVPRLAVIPRIDRAKRKHRVAITPAIQSIGRLGNAGKTNGHGNGSGNGASRRKREVPRPGRTDAANASPAASERLITLTDVRSSGSEAFRTLRTNLLFSDTAEGVRTLVVTSTTPGEGKTTTAANLAVTYAQQGVKVILVDCDLRKPQLHSVFEIGREPGLTQLVLGQSGIGEVVRETAVENLLVLPAGAIPPNPTELLGGARMRKTIADLVSRCEMVILDTSPISAGSDAAILGAACDGVIMVVRAGATDRESARQAMEQLGTVGARVLGGVFNDPDAELLKYGKYGGAYGAYVGYYGVEYASEEA
jgi:polysaccharide biosynthesis transport protein